MDQPRPIPFLLSIPLMPPRITILTAVCVFAMSTFQSSAGEAPLIINALDRAGLSLNGEWHTIVDPYENGFYDYRYEPYDATVPATGGYPLDRKQTDKAQLLEYDFDASPVLNVPGDWNSQDEKFFYYEGSVWYRKRFAYEKSNPNARVFVYIGAANYEAHVYLNGVKLGTHVGGFTPFNYEVTDLVRADGENSLVPLVDNKRERDAVPTLNTDWWNYGGITRDVRVIEVPPTFIRDHGVRLLPGDGDRLALDVSLDGPGKAGQQVTISIPELDIEATLETDESGKARGEIAASGLVRWSPENPRLYDVAISTAADRTVERMGFRTVETKGHEILLNGEPVFLCGVSIHEENPLRGGRAHSREDAELLLGWAKELGCNFVRLAHYPHNEYMARVADEMGIMVWEEVPVYWTISWENPDTLANAQAQLRAVVTRDINRASVIVWSMANETPVSEPRTKFLKTLVDQTRAMDDSRLISAAMEMHSPADNPDLKIVDDPFGAYTDIIAFNEYVGWYDGLPEKCDRVTFEIAYDKPVFISEFGAGALQGYHADALTRFSEEYQADVYKRTVTMLERIPNFRGCTPWILVDFRSPRRPHPVYQNGWNRKGLIGSNGEKKQAFFVLKDYYEKKAAEISK